MKPRIISDSLSLISEEEEMGVSFSLKDVSHNKKDFLRVNLSLQRILRNFSFQNSVDSKFWSERVLLLLVFLYLSCLKSLRLGWYRNVGRGRLMENSVKVLKKNTDHLCWYCLISTQLLF